MSSSETHVLREAILDEAANLFMQQGYKGISMREIASATGLSKAGLYYHFKDKQHLFLEILTRNLKSFGPRFQRIHEKGSKTSEKLELLVLEFLKTSTWDRSIAHLAEREMVHISQEEKQKFTNTYQELFLGPIVDIMKIGHANGELNCPDPVFATRVFLGMCWPFLMSHGAEIHGTMTPSDAKNLIHVFMHGFAKPEL